MRTLAEGEPCAREPRAFRDGDYAAGFEEPPPFGEAPSETDVVDRPFGPDEVELPVPEGKVVHRPYEACDPVVQPGAPHAGFQAFDHLGQQVHGRDRAAEVAGQHFGLMARAAADVGDAQVRTGFGEEFQCPEGLFVATGALSVDAAEKAGYEG